MASQIIQVMDDYDLVYKSIATHGDLGCPILGNLNVIRWKKKRLVEYGSSTLLSTGS